ncbi:MAG: FAD-dependent oxidoreductase, partial [Planctomycetales bacterium]|nr:FAD-dependent oxidoreductase [Planctomycetales bacterium]
MVSVCVSSSHIAFGSIRMEPVFMILGHSAATGAVLAIEQNIAVQDVPYDSLHARLLNDGQILEYESQTQKKSQTKFIAPEKLPGIVIDDDAASRTGVWKISSASANFVGQGYRHDDAAKDGRATAEYKADLPATGRYEVLISWPPHPNRASNATVELQTSTGSKTFSIDQRKKPAEDDPFHSLGVFDFIKTKPAIVRISNAESDGYVVIDAVQWLEQ